MKIVKILWILIGIIFLFWIYYLFISPFISKSKEITIPNIVMMEEAEAIKELSSLKLKYEINYIAGDSNTVKYIKPKAGTNVYQGSKVKLYVEIKEPEYYQMFEGLLYSEMKELIKEYCNKHNIILEIEYTIDEYKINDQIVAQSKNKDELIKEGDRLVLTINKTDSYFSMPNVVGMSILDAISLLNDYEIEYTIIYYNAPIIKDLILQQEIPPGTILKKKAKHIVRLYVSKGMPSDLFSVNILEICNILNDLGYNYDIIYVDSHIENVLIDIKYYQDKYLLYVSK